MSYEPSRSGADSARGILMLLGSGLLIAGCLLLFYIGLLIWQTINQPGEIPLVAFVMEHIKSGEEAISGSMMNSQNPGQEVKFDMRWSESMRLSVYLVVAALMFSAFARVGAILITSGSAIIRLAFPSAPKDDGKS